MGWLTGESSRGLKEPILGGPNCPKEALSTNRGRLVGKIKRHTYSENISKLNFAAAGSHSGRIIVEESAIAGIMNVVCLHLLSLAATAPQTKRALKLVGHTDNV